MSVATHTSTRALIYCRVSSKRQSREGSGLDSQEYRCRQYAEAKGYAVEAVFPDNVSGGGDFMNRPGMVALLAYMDARAGERFVVIFDDLKRYARDVEFHLALRRVMNERGAVRECLNFNFDDTPEGKFNEIVFAATGELERLQMARQNRQKSIARIEQGYCIQATPPIGFKYARDNGGGKVLAHDEPYASIVREALEGFASGRFGSQSEVKRFLDAQPEFPGRLKDNAIRPQQVRRMLDQIIYAGYVAAPKWGIAMRDGKHEGLISKETFWRIQDRLKERPALPARKDMHADFPLRGAVTCAACGFSLTGGWSKGKKKHYAYYLCHHYGCEERGKSIPVAKLNERFEDLLKSLTPSRPYLAMVKAMFTHCWDAQHSRLVEAMKIYADKARKLDEEIDKTVERMVEVANPRALKAFENRIEALERDKLIALENANKKPEPARPFSEVFEHTLRFLSNPYECWRIGTPLARKMVTRLVFDAPLSYDRNTGCLNTRKSNVFRMLDGKNVLKNKMVEPRGIEPLTFALRTRRSPI